MINDPCIWISYEYCEIQKPGRPRSRETDSPVTHSPLNITAAAVVFNRGCVVSFVFRRTTVTGEKPSKTHTHTHTGRRSFRPGITDPIIIAVRRRITRRFTVFHSFRDVSVSAAVVFRLHEGK